MPSWRSNNWPCPEWSVVGWMVWELCQGRSPNWLVGVGSGFSGERYREYGESAIRPGPALARTSGRVPVESQPDLGWMATTPRMGGDDTTVRRNPATPSDRHPATVGGLSRYPQPISADASSCGSLRACHGGFLTSPSIVNGRSQPGCVP